MQHKCLPSENNVMLDVELFHIRVVQWLIHRPTRHHTDKQWFYNQSNAIV